MRRTALSNIEVAEGIDNNVIVALPAKSWVVDNEKKRKVSALEPDVFERARLDQSLWSKTISHKANYIPGQDAVLVAKPSPKPYQASLGSVSEVPNEPGLVFPYFHGMLVADTAGLRSLTSKLFFRNFGATTDSDAREGFQNFRNNAGIIATSPIGAVIGHILKGFEMALDGQAHCFLMFDDEEYLGFCLLGDHFYVHNGTAWMMPVSAEDLRGELHNIATHESNLVAIVEVLSQTRDLRGDAIMVEKEEIDTPVGLLDTLAVVDESQGEQVKQLGKLIQNLHFKGGFFELGPQSIVWALEKLSNDRDSSLADRNLYIPLSDWQDCDTREFQVFAAFGPRAFHFLNRRGTRVPVPKSDEDVDIMASMSGEPPKMTFPYMLAYPCTVAEAVKKWEMLKETGTLILDFEERAQGSRALRWNGQSRDLIWAKLKELAYNHVFDSKAKEGKGKGVIRGTKRKVPEDFDLDAVLKDL
jgi:hypothetical protein